MIKYRILETKRVAIADNSFVTDDDSISFYVSSANLLIPVYRQRHMPDDDLDREG